MNYYVDLNITDIENFDGCPMIQLNKYEDLGKGLIRFKMPRTTAEWKKLCGKDDLNKAFETLKLNTILAYSGYFYVAEPEEEELARRENAEAKATISLYGISLDYDMWTETILERHKNDLRSDPLETPFKDRPHFAKVDIDDLPF